MSRPKSRTVVSRRTSERIFRLNIEVAELADRLLRTGYTDEGRRLAEAASALGEAGRLLRRRFEAASPAQPKSRTASDT